MSLTESIVEHTAVEWLGELVPQSRETGQGPQRAPGDHAGGTFPPAPSRGERESYGEVVLEGRLRRGHPAAETGHSRGGTGVEC
jgi:hypothetical protein